MNFLYQMILGDDNRPDEARFSYLIVQFTIVAAFIYNGLMSHHFQLLDICGAETALIAFYNGSIAVRGAIGKGS
jgi:hypothetical protein